MSKVKMDKSSPKDSAKEENSENESAEVSLKLLLFSLVALKV